ncbi:hypothetical protein [uncultured Dubosiella sp.]|uniref:hypothetical protein n=1 Tax=uncultured Dubosiella sp. TaxID=1937011 RepID=UPI0025B47676|nr:hypothetical protein [uncultured Dubosiella sp.]
MSEKQNILQSWIMVERLSEGNINRNDKNLLLLEDPKKKDFYTQIFCELKKKMINSKNREEQKKNKKLGFILYFGIFPFREVVSILCDQLQFSSSNEEIHYGDKFEFALYFDSQFHLLEDQTFYTVSAYIRDKKSIPNEREFQEFEMGKKNHFIQLFEERPDKDSFERFNEAIELLLFSCGIKSDDCRFQILTNVEMEAVNLHSFFIRDLEKAKKIDSVNLDCYLKGRKAGRKNLDSKRGSKNFDSDLFEQILEPKNYPLGRFPSNTKYALSLMQQVAVNLAIGFDNEQMRSVNGPPGTGKTTLLKDIFAELIVRQAYDIAKLTNHRIKGSEKTVYYKSGTIGVLPRAITVNNIMVASSNNGAVQNIVNELPLNKEIDSYLLEDLIKADYFCEIANMKNNPECEKDRNELDEKKWGLISLEGGKSENIGAIIGTIQKVITCLEKEYESDGSVYAEFIQQMKKVENIRMEKQKYAVRFQQNEKDKKILSQIRNQFDKERRTKEKECDEARSTFDQFQSQQKQQQDKLNENCELLEKVSNDKAMLNECLQMYTKKSGLRDLFNIFKKFFQKQAMDDEDKKRRDELVDQVIQSTKEEKTLREKEKKLKASISDLEEKLKQSAVKKEKLEQSFVQWKKQSEQKIATLNQRIHQFKNEQEKMKIVGFDMKVSYDKLQLSNLWFDEEYRLAQSRLFIKALQVRKQFLYENIKNVKGAINIWKNQENYLERIDLIEIAWHWINLTIPVISSTFASFGRMCRNIRKDTLGHLFIDEAGQALPQSAVGAIFRSEHVMVVGDPSQIKPVLTLDANVLYLIGKQYNVTEKHLSANASVQTLVDKASRYGYYRSQEKEEESWIGIPLWVHRRCRYPMFSISNKISYGEMMVQGIELYGNAEWYDIVGKADDKYVEEQGEFLLKKLKEMIKENPKISIKTKRM